MEIANEPTFFLIPPKNPSEPILAIRETILAGAGGKANSPAFFQNSSILPVSKYFPAYHSFFVAKVVTPPVTKFIVLLYPFSRSTPFSLSTLKASIINKALTKK